MDYFKTPQDENVQHFVCFLFMIELECILEENILKVLITRTVDSNSRKTCIRISGESLSIIPSKKTDDFYTEK